MDSTGGSDGHKFVELLRTMGQTPQNELVDLVIGKVVSTSPLKISVEGRELTSSFLILSPLCTQYTIKSQKEYGHTHPIPATDTLPGGDPSHSHAIAPWNTEPYPAGHLHEIIVWRGIVPGDTVIMLKVGKGQKYYVLHREEGLSQ